MIQEKKSKKLTYIILIIILLGVGIYFFISRSHTIPVLTTTYGDLNEYYLYVPGTRSTCTWTFLENGKPESFTSYPDTKTGQQNLLYNSTVSNTHVQCLNDQGIKYTGKF